MGAAHRSRCFLLTSLSEKQYQDDDEDNYAK